jgi:hypothetical protein
MLAVSDKISATPKSFFITAETIAKVKGQSVSHARVAFRDVKRGAGMNVRLHSIHVDIIIEQSTKIPYLIGITRNELLAAN